ncbi:MAG: sigma-70 family RNA polymerase sigma factor [Oscillospiraceae bacterium]|nr:sigma-70 family RNA polymerase sigma factor [Oscillospiraceae bacterium]
MEPEREKQLVKKASQGDGASFELLITDCADRTWALALRMMKDPQDAEDAVQDAMIKAWRALPGFKGECRFATWVFRLTYNTCLDALRRRQRGQVLSLTREDEDDGERQAEVPDPSPGPEEALLAKERAEILRRETEKLSDKLRAPLVMRELGGCSYEEIAAALGLSVGTVKSRIARARENLTEALVREGTFSARGRQSRRKGGDR